ncbi:uncharacterized protein HMPREF1541_09950 [Cyphellophora europaea CBS 101466]|uniref:Protein arginine N-methyltransferase n=1 Tax=Cyphellophora europaea (strain CBS 101466) TaxID=1220924 RepID=W2SAY1_CYPE1|nr:uncharacterized protein HMPREF1541_09950 [Cyphellophora europaea CBS 101466]ETN45074.1 hypothetical protein HMPREF1541_09950 [Cyphellophora europaea CBS 101466]
MEEAPLFFVGHHDPRRSLPVTAGHIQDAHAANYDMLTCPITTPYFHTRVLSKLSTHLPDSSSTSSIDLTRSTNASPVEIEALGPRDTPLTPDETTGQLIGVSSPWIDLSSPDPVIADVSRQVLKLELAYAAFCGLTYVLIPGPRMHNRADDGSGIVQYARAILDALALGPYMQLYIWMPLIDHSDNDKEDIGYLAPFSRQQFAGHSDGQSPRLDLFGTWEAWSTIRSICKYSSRLSIALDLPKLLPPVSIQSRWYSEPVRILTLDANIFLENQKGYPVLSRAHQALVSHFVRHKNPPWFLLSNVGPVPAVMNGGMDVKDSAAFPALGEAFSAVKEPTPHLWYMRNLQNKQPPPSLIERFGAGYQDYLQAPLQPLTVNLESITYEVFEKDPIKYDWYEQATARALSDWISQRKPASGTDGRIVVAVVGAGRGPLVTRALKAAETVGIDIDMWALEKNPNAFVLLQRHNDTIWNHRVNLVKSDMRTWRGPVHQENARRVSEMLGQTKSIPQGSSYTGSVDTDSTYLLATAARQPTYYKIDILISELLGSFADNELSPECLDGVQHLLNPTHGISIPTSYTAFISPIAAPKLYADINNSMVQTTPHAAETPYVVMLNAIDHLSTTTNSPQTNTSAPRTLSNSRSSSIPSPPTPLILPCWSFQHPNPHLPSSPPSTNAHNTRHTVLHFPVPHRGACHGLAGYFECVLYTVVLSTNPNTMADTSPDMMSWFPLYFPLKSAVWFPDDSECVVTLWRREDGRKVWYEWMVEAFVYVDEGGRTRGKRGKANASGKGRGRRIKVGGSEVHSSFEEGCLM